MIIIARNDNDCSDSAVCFAFSVSQIFVSHKFRVCNSSELCSVEFNYDNAVLNSNQIDTAKYLWYGCLVWLKNLELNELYRLKNSLEF